VTSACSIEIVGHGGAGDFFPGNSRSSVQKALDLKVDRIEIDLVAEAGGELLLVHNHVVRLATGAKAKVRSLRSDQVRERVDELLTIDEFFDLIGPSMPVLLDLKQPGYERAVVDAVSRQTGRNIWISTTHALSVVRLHAKLPGVPIGLSSGHVATGFSQSPLRPLLVRAVRALMPVPFLIVAKCCGASMIMVNFRACSPWLVRVARAGGLRVAVWTVNRPADIQKMIDLQVDAIISNRPDLVRELLED
jgi:glycerophosphoryl diester phosphodiesterase